MHNLSECDFIVFYYHWVWMIVVYLFGLWFKMNDRERERDKKYLYETGTNDKPDIQRKCRVGRLLFLCFSINWNFDIKHTHIQNTIFSLIYVYLILIFQQIDCRANLNSLCSFYCCCCYCGAVNMSIENVQNYKI